MKSFEIRNRDDRVICDVDELDAGRMAAEGYSVWPKTTPPTAPKVDKTRRLFWIVAIPALALFWLAVTAGVAVVWGAS